MIIRVVKDRDNPYVMLNKKGLYDKELSWKAKGIWAYLLNRPDNWQVYETEIVKHSKDSRHSVRSGIKELMEAGYITRTEQRNDKGQFKGYEYCIYEISNRVRKSDVGKSDVGKSNPINNDLLSIELTYKRIKGILRKQNSWRDIDEFKTVLDYYFIRYKQHTGKEHPVLSKKCCREIADTLFFVKNIYTDDAWDIDADDLIAMINKHFRTKYEDCDWNIMHFLCEGVKYRRWEEACQSND